MKSIIYGLFVVFSVVTLYSCQKASVEKNELATSIMQNKFTASAGYIEPGCPVTSVKFIAGQNINAGTIETSNDANFIYVTYKTANGYVLRETHLYAGSCNAIPVNRKGNPTPGLFPFKNTHNNVTTFTYQIPISTIGFGKCGCVAAHAAVVKLGSNGSVIDSQTAWGSGTPIVPGQGNWGTKFDYCTCTGGQSKN